MIEIVSGGRGFNGRETLPLRLEAGEKILSAGCSARRNETSERLVPAGKTAVCVRVGSPEELALWAIGPTAEVEDRYVLGTQDCYDGYRHWTMSRYVRRAS